MNESTETNNVLLDGELFVPLIHYGEGEQPFPSSTEPLAQPSTLEELASLVDWNSERQPTRKRMRGSAAQSQEKHVQSEAARRFAMTNAIGMDFNWFYFSLSLPLFLSFFFSTKTPSEA